MEEIRDCLGRLACCGNAATGYVSSLYKGHRTTAYLSIGETFTVERDNTRTDVTRITTSAFKVRSYKLIFAHSMVLKPYLEALRSGCKDAPMRRIQEIQTLLLENAEQRETLTKLMAQGYIDQILYNEENNSLLSQADRYRQEMDSLSKAIGGEGAHANATQDLLRYVEKAAMLTDFDETLFENTVDRIKVLSREEIAFELKCGLTLKERI